MKHSISGRFGQYFDELYFDGERLDPHPSQAVFNHSPDGFSWGYGGSGPAQAALGILLAALEVDPLTDNPEGDVEIAVLHHQEFKNDFVAKWPQADFDVELDVTDWLRRVTTAGVV